MCVGYMFRREETHMGAPLAWPPLPPRNFVCDVVGAEKSEYRDLVRMLINSLVWTTAGVFAIALTV